MFQTTAGSTDFTVALEAIKFISTPFMLGSISLIVFLAQRTIYLAGKTRDLCDQLRRADANQNRFISGQIPWLVKRHRLSNLALQFAICAVAFFGSMLLACAVLQTTWTRDGPAMLLTGLLICGGACDGVATAIALLETHRATVTLCTHVAATIVSHAFPADLPPCVHGELDDLKGISRGRIDPALYGELVRKCEELAQRTR